MTSNEHNGNGTISEMLRALPDRFSTPSVTVAQLKDELSGRSYGIFLLVLSVPNLVPIPAPGLSAVLGLPLVLFTFQLMLGLKTPWFPGFIARRRVKCESLKRVCNRISPYLKKLEYINKPRLKFLMHPPLDRVIALFCLLLSLLIMLPVPFGNALPALAICLFALGILQRDGLFVIFGFVVACVAVTVISTVISGAVMSVTDFIDF